MKLHSSALLGVLACGVALGSVCAQEPAEQTGTLKFKAFKSFQFILPKDVWTKVSGGVTLKHPGGESFRAQRDGLKLRVDTTGDGRMNKDVKGTKGYLKFRTKGFQYAARFRGNKGGYHYATSCAMVGSVAGIPLHLIDLNNNGTYNELGEDAIVVGKSKAAAYLSKAVSYKGKVYNIEVSENGRDVTVTPYDGEVGTLNLAAGFKSRGKLDSAIVSDGNGNSFNVAGFKSGLVVPTGSYTIVSGQVHKGSQSARIKSGKMNGLTVRADKVSKLSWGGPLMAEFSHALGEGKVTVDPKNLHIYGKAGEEYTDWIPGAKSPKFTVRDPDTGKEVGHFIFTSC